MAVDGSNKNLKMLVFEQEVNEKLSNMENKYNIIKEENIKLRQELNEVNNNINLNERSNTDYKRIIEDQAKLINSLKTEKNIQANELCI